MFQGEKKKKKTYIYIYEKKLQTCQHFDAKRNVMLAFCKVDAATGKFSTACELRYQRLTDLFFVALLYLLKLTYPHGRPAL